jgi:hypothetical protein
MGASVTRTDVAVNDLARALADLKVKSQEQKRAIFEQSLASLVRFAISEYQVSQVIGTRDDMARVDEILQQSKQQ